MLQPCCNRSRTHLDRAGKERRKKTAKTAYICVISRQGSTYPESSNITYKEEVAGSNPASPTYKSPANSDILRTGKDGWEALPGPVAGTRVRLFLRQHSFHRFGGGVLHGGSSDNLHSDDQQGSIVPKLF
jgi:hypothetical protein